MLLRLYSSDKRDQGVGLHIDLYVHVYHTIFHFCIWNRFKENFYVDVDPMQAIAIKETSITYAILLLVTEADRA